MRYVSKTFTVKLVSDKWDLGAPLRSSEDVFHYVESIYRGLDADKEHFVLIVQNNKNRVQGHKVISTGSLKSQFPSNTARVINNGCMCAMKKAGVLSILFVAVPLAIAVIAEAQQPKKVPRIGYLAAGSALSASARIEAFRQGLRALGYVEGKDILIEYRNAAGKLDQVPRNAVELVRLKVDVFVTAGPTDTRAAKEATSTIPIVMAQDSDPVGNGFVASLARPGGNITGLSRLAPELSGKQLELLKETVPRLSRVVVLGNSTEPGNAQSLREMELATGALGVKLQYLDILALQDIESAFQAARKGRADAVLVLTSPVLTQRKRIADLAITTRLPAIYDRREFVDAGGLMSYGVRISDLDQRAATYVDKILKGAKAADLPVEQPTKFELIINLKAAKQIGLTIPPNVLARADKVIK